MTWPNIKLVLIETASRVGSGDEKDNAGMAALIDGCELIAVTTGAAVCLVHHLPKQAATEGRLDQYALRGGGALADNARSVLLMAAVTSEMTEALMPPESVTPEAIAQNRVAVCRHAKASYSQKATDLWLIRERDSPIFNGALAQPQTADSKLERLISYIRRVQGARTPPLLSKRYLQASCREVGLSKSSIAELLEIASATHRLVTEQKHQRGDKGQRVTVYRVPLDEAPDET